jgi:mediator of RNA polymerase II transcription subunit 8
MQREEKQQDAALEAIIMRVNDLKNSIGSMLVKLEHEYETLNWPTFLDNFALMSGHVSYISLVFYVLIGTRIVIYDYFIHPSFHINQGCRTCHINLI